MQQIFNSNKHVIIQFLLLVYSGAQLLEIILDHYTNKVDIEKQNSILQMSLILSIIIINLMCLILIIKYTMNQKYFFITHSFNIFTSIFLQELAFIQSKTVVLSFSLILTLNIHSYQKLFLLNKKIYPMLVLLILQSYFLIRNIQQLNLNIQQSFQLSIILIIITFKILPFNEGYFFEQQSAFFSTKNIQSGIQKGMINQSESQFVLNNNGEDFKQDQSKKRIQEQKGIINDPNKEQDLNLSKQQFSNFKSRDIHSYINDQSQCSLLHNPLNECNSGMQDLFDSLKTGILFLDEQKNIIMQNKQFIQTFKTYLQDQQELQQNVSIQNQGIEVQDILKISLNYSLPKRKLIEKKDFKKEGDVFSEEMKKVTVNFEENSKQLKEFFIKEQEKLELQQMQQSILHDQYLKNQKGVNKNNQYFQRGGIQNEQELSQIVSDREESVQSKDMRQSNLVTNQSSLVFNNCNANGQFDLSYCQNNFIIDREVNNCDTKVRQAIQDFQQKNLQEALKKAKQCRISGESLQKFFDLDPLEIDLERLIDYLLISKPFVTSDELQESNYDENTDQNMIKNKKLNQQFKKEGKYRLKICNNVIIISMERFSKTNLKNEMIEIKISCLYYEDLSDNNKINQQLSSNQCKQADKNSDQEPQKIYSHKKQNKSASIKGLPQTGFTFHQNQLNNNNPPKKQNQTKGNLVEEKNIQQKENSRDENYNQNHADLKYYLIIEVHEIGLNTQSIIKQDLDKYRTKILCSVSHELRTPLNCTITMLDMLNYREDISDLIKNLYINPALFSSYILLNIINDILDMAEVSRTGQISMIFQEFSPASVCLECLQFIKLQAMQKNLQLEFQADENVPKIIYTDISKTRQVLLNLLNNALKYTQKGSIAIKLSSPQENLIQVDVKDTGCGIPQHALKQIFFNFTEPKLDKNHQNHKFNDTTTTKSQINAGLGLSISYCLAAGLGDNRKMNVTSQVDKGSTFTFYLANRPQKKKGCTLFPNIKQIDGQASSLNSRDWIEYDSYLHSQGKLSLQENSQLTTPPSNFESNFESSIKNIQDNLKDKTIINENDNETQVRELDYHNKKPSSNRLIKNNLSFFNGIRSSNQINYHRNLQTEEYDNQHKDQSKESKEELYPETDRYIGKTLKKHLGGQALQINLSKTTLQIIKQTSTLLQLMQSQRELEDNCSNKKISTSSSRNLANQITLEQQYTLDPQLTMEQQIKGGLTKVFTEELENNLYNQTSITSMLFRNKNTEHMLTMGTQGTKDLESQSRQHLFNHYNTNSKKTNFTSRNPSSKFIKDKTIQQFDTLQECQSVKDIVSNNKTQLEDQMFKKIHFDESSIKKSSNEDGSVKKSFFDESSNLKSYQDDKFFKRQIEDSKKSSHFDDNKRSLYNDSTYKNMIYEELDLQEENQTPKHSFSKKDIESCNIINESFEKKPTNSIEYPQITKIKLKQKYLNQNSQEFNFKQQFKAQIYPEQKKSGSLKYFPPDNKQQQFYQAKQENKQLTRPNSNIQKMFYPNSSINNSGLFNQTSNLNNNLNNSNQNNQINAFNLNSNLNCLNMNLQVISPINNSLLSQNQNNLNCNQQSSNYNSILNLNYYSSLQNNIQSNQTQQNSQNCQSLNVQNNSINTINYSNNINGSFQSPLSSLRDIEPLQKLSMDGPQDYRSQQLMAQGCLINGEEIRQSLICMNKYKLCTCPQILIVDDNEFNLYALEVRLKMYQFNVEKATSGYQSIELIKKRSENSCCKNFSLVFMDIDMPHKNGYETTEEIIQLCSQLQIQAPPISACSAFIQESDKEKAYKYGMSYYLTKPINQQAFENILMKVYFSKV